MSNYIFEFGNVQIARKEEILFYDFMYANCKWEVSVFKSGIRIEKKMKSKCNLENLFNDNVKIICLKSALIYSIVNRKVFDFQSCNIYLETTKLLCKDTKIYHLNLDWNKIKISNNVLQFIYEDNNAYLIISYYILGMASKNEIDKLLNLWSSFNAIYKLCDNGKRKKEVDRIQGYCKRFNIFNEYIPRNFDKNTILNYCCELANASSYDEIIKACNELLKKVSKNKTIAINDIKTANEFIGISVAYKLRCYYSHAEKSKIIFCFENDVEVKYLKYINSCLNYIVSKFVFEELQHYVQ